MKIIGVKNREEARKIVQDKICPECGKKTLKGPSKSKTKLKNNIVSEKYVIYVCPKCQIGWKIGR